METAETAIATSSKKNSTGNGGQSNDSLIALRDLVEEYKKEARRMTGKVKELEAQLLTQAQEQV